jgi:hypothetical protein
MPSVRTSATSAAIGAESAFFTEDPYSFVTRP